MRYSRLILVGTAIAILTAIGLAYFGITHPRVFGTTADWVSGIGAVGAILFINEELRQEKRRQKNEDIFRFQEAVDSYVLGYARHIDYENAANTICRITNSSELRKLIHAIRSLAKVYPSFMSVKSLSEDRRPYTNQLAEQNLGYSHENLSRMQIDRWVKEELEKIYFSPKLRFEPHIESEFDKLANEIDSFVRRFVTCEVLVDGKYQGSVNGMNCHQDEIDIYKSELPKLSKKLLADVEVYRKKYSSQNSSDKFDEPAKRSLEKERVRLYKSVMQNKHQHRRVQLP